MFREDEYEDEDIDLFADEGVPNTTETDEPTEYSTSLESSPPATWVLPFESGWNGSSELPWMVSQDNEAELEHSFEYHEETKVGYEEGGYFEEEVPRFNDIIEKGTNNNPIGHPKHIAPTQYKNTDNDPIQLATSLNRENKRLYLTIIVMACVIMLVGGLVIGLWAKGRLVPFHVTVEGESMEPTLYAGDTLNAYSGDIHVGDVVVLEKYGKLVIKRVIATEGMVVTAEGRRILVDGKVVAEVPSKDLLYNLSGSRVQVGPGTLFVIGDNLENSQDSRSFGVISKSNVVGVVSTDPPHNLTFTLS